MKALCRYYLVDTLTETIVGSFFAINDNVASKIVADTIKGNEKLQLIVDSLELRTSGYSVSECECFDEVLDECKVIISV